MLSIQNWPNSVNIFLESMISASFNHALKLGTCLFPRELLPTIQNVTWGSAKNSETHSSRIPKVPYFDILPDFVLFSILLTKESATIQPCS